jgi:hypothetical protein
MLPGDVFALGIVSIVTGVVILSIFHRLFSFREKKLEIQAQTAAERAGQYGFRTAELEQRIRVLEQIVTDNGAQTAAQIEALRGDSPASPRKRVAADNPAA